MLGLGKTGTVRASATACSQDIYQRYAAALYRQALLTLDDSAMAEHVVCDAIVNEYALAAMPGRGEDIRAGRALGIHPRDMAALVARGTAQADNFTGRRRRRRRRRSSMRACAAGQCRGPLSRTRRSRRK